MLKRHNQNLFISLAIIVLVLPLIYGEAVCNQTSDALECFACSNTSPRKNCSDDNGNGNPITSKWTVLKSPPGQPIDNFR